MSVRVLHGLADARFELRPVPESGADEVLIRVPVVGTFVSDVDHYRHGRIGLVAARTVRAFGVAEVVATDVNPRAADGNVSVLRAVVLPSAAGAVER
jgi:threonine dehydrogenase-like Zn-dependent dehydrogenase